MRVGEIGHLTVRVPIGLEEPAFVRSELLVAVPQVASPDTHAARRHGERESGQRRVAPDRHHVVA
ncbi:hypothetical protein AB0F91_12425 [Amycolatopsis sp. NPDC023774]|uniref:hypothetical protein n=1 Tax=Amycolatopsis sp. NPDC023774 TaxID=3155015 RepID=UPI0033CF4C48